jgi:RNA polymerase sigma-70 factor, ECF subfamily
MTRSEIREPVWGSFHLMDDVETRPETADTRARFEADVERLLPRLHRLCLALCRDKQEAEDLLQDSLVRAYLHRDSYQQRGSFFGWLCGITRNQFLESRRSWARRRSLLDSVLEGATSVLGSLFTGGTEQPDPEALLCRSEEAELLMRSLHSLPEKFRLVVLLCDVEELGYEAVSEALGIPVGTVKSRHSRGRAQLGQCFKSLVNAEAQVAAAGGHP